jgi:histidyl-tRNA synthetase
MKKKKENSLVYENLRQSIIPAAFFGFEPLHVRITEEDRKNAKIIDKKGNHDCDPDLNFIDFKTEEKVALLRLAQEKGVQGGQPLMIYSENENKNNINIHLDVIGNSKGISEALTIASTIAILNNLKIEHTLIINCIGDKDSTHKFTKALTEYYRTHINALPPKCRQLMKKDIFSVTHCAREMCPQIAEEAPKSMNFLSEQSRIHFKEVLDYLDFSNISYIIDDTLLPNKNYSSHVVFKITNSKESPAPILAFGSRYNFLSKKLGNKREMGAVGITLVLNKKQLGETKKKIKIPTSPFFFIHIGTEARLKSIGVLEALRQKNIPINHAIIKDKLSGQLTQAEEKKTKHVLLMGQRECIDNSVIIRNNENRSQKAVKLSILADTLKKLL